MEIYKSFKTRIYPTKEQIEYFNKCFGISRFAYNWYLENNQKYYEEGNRKSFYELRKEFNQLKYQKDYKWLLETNNKIIECALGNANDAFKRFFNKQCNYPKYKSKHNFKQSFVSCRCIIYSNYSHFKKNKRLFDGKHFYISGKQENRKCNGYFIKTKEDIWFLKDKEIKLITIFKQNNEYYVSLAYKDNINYINNSTKKVGIDIGIKTFATQSDNKISQLPKRLNMYYRKIDKLNQVLSKKTKGSNNYEKARTKLNKYYRKVKDLKLDYCHKYTTYLAKNYKDIKIEDIDISEWFKDEIKFSKNLQKSCLGLFRSQLEYKTTWYDSKLTKIDRYYPSSKVCSKCGNIKQDLKLSDRIYKCNNCGTIIDRDLNAAINILNY